MKEGFIIRRISKHTGDITYYTGIYTNVISSWSTNIDMAEIFDYNSIRPNYIINGINRNNYDAELIDTYSQLGTYISTNDPALKKIDKYREYIQKIIAFILLLILLPIVAITQIKDKIQEYTSKKN